MKAELLKRLPVVLISAVVLVGSTGVALADTTTRPYLKTFGSDVMTGGWFNNGINCSTDSTSNYQSPNYAPAGVTADARNGGILTYSKTAGTSSGGDSSQYAAYSVGSVDGPNAPNIDGFYSAGAQAAVGSTSVKALTFANTDVSYQFGGVFEGSTPQGNCVPDFYAKKPATTNMFNNLHQAVVTRGGAGGFFDASTAPGAVMDIINGFGDQQIPAGERLTVFINGNVYINNNITYDPASTVDNVPKFALIVTGSIYIDKGVSRLDGMYVAQPVPKCDSSGLPAGCNNSAAYNPVTADTGIIWTCHPNNTNPLDYTYPSQCPTSLTVNGALIAKQVNFLRIKGDIVSASTAEDSLAGGFSSTNISEIANYTPAMIMGGDFFSTTGSATTGGLPIDSIISLPPVF
jgi:hypothetical protein